MNWASIFRVLMTLTLQGSVALVLVALLNFILGLFKAVFHRVPRYRQPGGRLRGNRERHTGI